MNTTKTLYVNDDLVIDIHYNPNLSNRPYQLRVYSYYDYSEHRLDTQDMNNLAQGIIDFISESNK